MSEQNIKIEETSDEKGFYATINDGSKLLAFGIATGFRLPPELIVIAYLGTDEQFNEAYAKYLASQQQDQDNTAA